MARMRITIGDDGPYVVRGGVPLIRAEIITNDVGEAVAWRETEIVETPETYRLCRCGSSGDKPFCDMSHVIEGFDGTETAAHDPYFETAACITGPGVKLRDVRELCAEARFCDRAGGVWNLVLEASDTEKCALIDEIVALCPSGRYVACDADTDVPHEREYEPSIVLVDDPQLGVSGPLWVRGGVEIVGANDTAYETRNRVTLCRCGNSKNKPFCDGSHIAAEFRE